MGIVIVRTLIIYIALLLVMRILGKRQLGEMELSEFVVAALIADLAAHPLQDIGIPMINGLVPIMVLFCGELLIAGASLKSNRLREILFGKPSILIRKGKIDQSEMHKNRFTIDELMQELRSQGVSDVEKIEYAVLETDGRLNVMLSASENPVTPAQLGIVCADRGAPVVLIKDGRLMSETMCSVGYDEKKLREELRARGVHSVREVFLMSVNAAGDVYFCKKEGRR